MKKTNEKGFTIIEVMIVLAIAGLILLIVFLAVPALQRNSRNNARKSEIARVAAGVNDFIANNNGSLPNNTEMGTVVTQLGALNQFAATDRLNNESGDEGIMASASGRPRFRLVSSAACGTAGAAVQSSPRRAAIQYQLETTDNDNHQNLCLEV